MLRVLGFVVGDVILLLPGACSAFFMVVVAAGGLGEDGNGAFWPLSPFWLFCFALSYGGYRLIRKALRGLAPPAQRRIDVMRVLGFLVGVILLLPGACALAFMGLSLGDSGSEGPLPLLWIACLAISVGGVFMIRNAVRGRRKGD